MQGLCQGLLSFQDIFNLIILFACSTKQTLHRWCIRRKFEWQASAAQQPRRPNLHGPFLRQPLALSQGSTPPTGSRPHLGAKMAQGAANAPTLFPEHMTVPFTLGPSLAWHMRMGRPASVQLGKSPPKSESSLHATRLSPPGVRMRSGGLKSCPGSCS